MNAGEDQDGPNGPVGLFATHPVREDSRCEVGFAKEARISARENPFKPKSATSSHVQSGKNGAHGRDVSTPSQNRTNHAGKKNGLGSAKARGDVQAIPLIISNVTAFWC